MIRLLKCSRFHVVVLDSLLQLVVTVLVPLLLLIDEVQGFVGIVGLDLGITVTAPGQQ